MHLTERDQSINKSIHHFPLFPSTNKTRPMRHELTQTRRYALPRPRRASVACALSDNLRNTSPILTTPPMPLPPTFSTLAGLDPNSKEFLQTLGLFLQGRADHKPLKQPEGSAAVDVVDILDEVRSHWAMASHEIWTDFRVAFGWASAFLPPRNPHTYPPPLTFLLRVMGGIAYLQHVSTRSSAFESRPMGSFKFFRSAQGDIGWGSSRHEVSSSAR